MRLLVIGRTGQVARALAGAAPDAAFLGRETVDLERPDTIAPAVRAAAPEVVINAAAYTAVDRAEEERDRAHAVNATAVGAIATACAGVGAALMHLSTDYVFPGRGTAPHRPDDPTGPVNAYGASKLAGEVAALAANPRTAIFRTSWVYAPWGKNFVLTMLRLADRERLTIVDDQIGQPTSALDIAGASLAIAARLAPAPAGAPVFGRFHLAAAGETSWAGFARAIFDGARARGLIPAAPEVVPIPTAEYPTPAARPLNSRLDGSATEAVFGVAMRPWPEALAAVLDRIAADRADPA